MSCSPPIDRTEELGRALVFRRFIARGGPNKDAIRPDAFAPVPDTKDISAHRLTHIPSEQCKLKLAKAVALSRRGDPSKFYGWAVLPVWQAEGDGREVVASGTPENIYHADILLPEKYDPRDENEHLNLLAARSKLVKPPR